MDEKTEHTVHRKAIQMTNDDVATPPRARKSGRRGQDGQRVEKFSPTGPIWAKIDTQSGDVIVRASDTEYLKIILSTSLPKDAYLLEHADITFDAANNTLNIRTLPRGVSLSSSGLRIGPGRSWFNFGSSDVTVLVEVPQGSSLEVSTISGDIYLYGSLGSVKVKSASGDVQARNSSEELDVRTASGDVVCSSAAAKTRIYSASGDLVLVVDQPGKVVVRNESGDVSVSVARGVAVDVSCDSVSGDIGSNIDLDATGGATGGDEVTVLKVRTVSGHIRIHTA